MRMLVFVLYLALPMAAMLTFADRQAETTSAWLWASIGYAVAISIPLLRWCLDGWIAPVRWYQWRSGFLTVALVMAGVGWLPWFALYKSAPMMIRDQSTQTIDVLESRRGVITDAMGAGYDCGEQLSFNLADGTPEALCADLILGGRLQVPGRALLTLRQSWAGRLFVRIDPLPMPETRVREGRGGTEEAPSDEYLRERETRVGGDDERSR